MQSIAVANHKGGVGKTATAHALATALAQAGRRVLMVDVDPQAALTTSNQVKIKHSLADVIGGSKPGLQSLAGITVKVAPNLDLAPASKDLADCELGLTQRLGRETVLKKALASVAGKYDVAIIDCPPSLGLLTVNALAAANAVVIPTQPSAVDLRGLVAFKDTLDQIRQELNPKLCLLGILVTFYDRRYSNHQAAIEALEKSGLPIFTTRISRSVRVAEAAEVGESIITYEPSHPATAAYRTIGEEINQWLEKNQT